MGYWRAVDGLSSFILTEDCTRVERESRWIKCSARQIRRTLSTFFVRSRQRSSETQLSFISTARRALFARPIVICSEFLEGLPYGKPALIAGWRRGSRNRVTAPNAGPTPLSASLKATLILVHGCAGLVSPFHPPFTSTHILQFILLCGVLPLSAFNLSPPSWPPTKPSHTCVWPTRSVHTRHNLDNLSGVFLEILTGINAFMGRSRTRVLLLVQPIWRRWRKGRWLDRALIFPRRRTFGRSQVHRARQLQVLRSHPSPSIRSLSDIEHPDNVSSTFDAGNYAHHYIRHPSTSLARQPSTFFMTLLMPLLLSSRNYVCCLRFLYLDTQARTYSEACRVAVVPFCFQSQLQQYRTPVFE
ncbi:hypothetical protein BKA62DRAFT_218560 [Auriculariales sp. MPI-PUGE-AT-0066]|nr:hypothetical protein BKA62DRAFT_218560 [Auriculariales sp. MPI-PUGE-AT-0066]